MVACRFLRRIDKPCPLSGTFNGCCFRTVRRNGVLRRALFQEAHEQRAGILLAVIDPGSSFQKVGLTLQQIPFQIVGITVVGGPVKRYRIPFFIIGIQRKAVIAVITARQAISAGSFRCKLHLQPCLILSCQCSGPFLLRRQGRNAFIYAFSGNRHIKGVGSAKVGNRHRLCTRRQPAIAVSGYAAAAAVVDAGKGRSLAVVRIYGFFLAVFVHNMQLKTCKIQSLRSHIFCFFRQALHGHFLYHRHLFKAESVFGCTRFVFICAVGKCELHSGSFVHPHKLVIIIVLRTCIVFFRMTAVIRASPAAGIICTGVYGIRQSEMIVRILIRSEGKHSRLIRVKHSLFFFSQGYGFALRCLFISGHPGCPFSDIPQYDIIGFPRFQEAGGVFEHILPIGCRQFRTVRTHAEQSSIRPGCIHDLDLSIG